jgi:acetyl esterase/lipase
MTNRHVMEVTFRRLTDDDLPLLHDWLNESGVVRWWEGDDVSWAGGSTTGAPVWVYFHGSFVLGNKMLGARPLIYRLAARGWVCVSANRRLFRAEYQDQLADARAALAWVRDRGRRLSLRRTTSTPTARPTLSSASRTTPSDVVGGDAEP